MLITPWDITYWCSINLLWKELMERMSEHTGLISSYQLLITAACTNTGGKMKGSHSRAADWCPFVPVRRQAIIWTNTGILLIGHWGTNFSEVLIGIHTLSVKKIHLEMSSGKWRPFCLGLNVLMNLGDYKKVAYLCCRRLPFLWNSPNG